MPRLLPARQGREDAVPDVRGQRDRPGRRAGGPAGANVGRGDGYYTCDSRLVGR